MAWDVEVGLVDGRLKVLDRAEPSDSPYPGLWESHRDMDKGSAGSPRRTMRAPTAG